MCTLTAALLTAGLLGIVVVLGIWDHRRRRQEWDNASDAERAEIEEDEENRQW